MTCMNPARRIQCSTGFMECQLKEGLELAAASDLLSLRLPPVGPQPWWRSFAAPAWYAIETVGFARRTSSMWESGFRRNYLRRANPFEMLRLFTPHVWHPNISSEAPFLCIGRLSPGMALVDILYQIFDILTYRKYNPLEHDALNPAACAWARANQHRFPIDPRPLKRCPLELEVTPHG